MALKCGVSHIIPTSNTSIFHYPYIPLAITLDTDGLESNHFHIFGNRTSVDPLITPLHSVGRWSLTGCTGENQSKNSYLMLKLIIIIKIAHLLAHRLFYLIRLLISLLTFFVLEVCVTGWLLISVTGHHLPPGLNLLKEPE